MDTWLILAFLAPLFWSFTNILDKFLLEKHAKDPFSLAVYMDIAFFVLSLFLVLFTDLAAPFSYILIAVLIGLLNFFSFLFGFKAMAVEDASVVVPLIFVYPVFTTLFAFLFLGETVSLGQYAGAALLILSSVLIALKRNLGKLAVSPALKFMLVSVLLTGAMVTVEKFALGSISPYALLFWSNFGLLGASLAALALFPGMRKRFVGLLHLRPKIAGIAWLCNGTCFVAALLFYLALSVGPATLVSSLNALQPFFVLVMILLLSRFLPHLLKEEHTSRMLLLKVLAVLFVLIGSYLVAA